MGRSRKAHPHHREIRDAALASHKHQRRAAPRSRHPVADGQRGCRAGGRDGSRLGAVPARAAGSAGKHPLCRQRAGAAHDRARVDAAAHRLSRAPARAGTADDVLGHLRADDLRPVPPDRSREGHARRRSSRELAPYLGERPPHIVFTDDLRKFSREVVGDEKQSVSHRAETVRSPSIAFPGPARANTRRSRNISDYALHAGHADCGQQTLLLMTLLRLNGIPARWQSGMIFSDGDYDNLHDWGWLYLAPYGWVPMDVTFGTLDAGDPQLDLFYLGGLDAYRIAFNDDYSQPFAPAEAALPLGDRRPAARRSRVARRQSVLRPVGLHIQGAGFMTSTTGGPGGRMSNRVLKAAMYVAMGMSLAAALPATVAHAAAGDGSLVGHLDRRQQQAAADAIGVEPAEIEQFECRSPASSGRRSRPSAPSRTAPDTASPSRGCCCSRRRRTPCPTASARECR